MDTSDMAVYYWQDLEDFALISNRNLLIKLLKDENLDENSDGYAIISKEITRLDTLIKADTD